MEKPQVLAQIRSVGLIPILRTPSPDDALMMAEILVEAGLSNLEIPLTVPGAIEVIRELADRYRGRLLVGAGTVLDPASAEACVAAGATFIISPGLNVDTVTACRKMGIATFPGSLTPTEIIAAWRAGADMVKVFPVSAVGGAPYLKAIKAPLPQIELVPTGGVSVETAATFIQAGASALGVGGDLVDVAALREGRGHVIAARARAYLSAVQLARGV